MEHPKQEYNYEFKMFDLRKKLLQSISCEIRNISSKAELFDIKWDMSDLIEKEIKPKKNPPETVSKRFRSSFEVACEIVLEDTPRRILPVKICEIPDQHDGEIEPIHIDGYPIELILSYKPDNGGIINRYPVYHHSSDYRVCSCPAQRYNMLCPHTISRLIDRNMKWDFDC